MDIFIWQGYWQGGAERITLGVAEKLKERGIEPSLGVFEKNKTVEFPQIKVREIFPLPGYSKIWASFQLNRKGILDNYDIVFTHQQGLWKTGNNFHVYYEPEDRENKYYKQSLKQKIASSFLIEMAKRSLENCDLAICTDNSEDFVKTWASNYEKSGGFVDTEKFHPPQNESNQDEEDRVNILYVGREDPRKNFESLKTACQNLEDYVSLRVIGFSGKDEKNIKYSGRVSDKELVRAYQKADLFVLPSFYEGFGISSLEALACGTPVIYSRTACPESLKDYVILCEPNSENIEEKIRDFIKNKEKISERTIKKVPEIRENFGKENVLSDLVNKICSVAE